MDMKKAVRKRRCRDVLTGIFAGFVLGVIGGALAVGVLLLYCRMAGPF